MQNAADFRDGKLLRIFVDEADRRGLQPTYTAIVEFLRKRGVAGATVFRGIEGFGGHGEVHIAKVFSWLPNLPILIEGLKSYIENGAFKVDDVEIGKDIAALKPGKLHVEMVRGVEKAC